MRVLFITNVPSPYRVDFFNELGKYCSLTVCYERNSASNRERSWFKNKDENYDSFYTNSTNIGTDKTIGFGLIKEIRIRSFDKLILSGYSSPSVFFAIIYCQVMKIPYYIECDGGLNVLTKNYKTIIKRILLRRAVGIFTTCEEHISYLLKLGVERDKIIKYPFSSVFLHDIASSIPSEDEKNSIREKLGIGESKVVLSVGQFIYRKGFDVLIESSKSFSKDVGVYIVGGIPTYEYMELKKKLNLNNLHFISFMDKKVLREWYRASDVFVLPTREDIWGLVVNEAMAQGLPVITTCNCMAGLELVRDGNGRIVKIDSPNEIAYCVNELLSNKNMLLNMSKKSLEIISDYTIERMVATHLCELNTNRK